MISYLHQKEAFYQSPYLSRTIPKYVRSSTNYADLKSEKVIHSQTYSRSKVIKVSHRHKMILTIKCVFSNKCLDPVVREN